MIPVVNCIIQQQVFPTLHTDARDRLDDISPHHKPHFPQDPKCFQAFSQQHGAIRRGAFRHGAHGDARLRQQEDRGGAWCAGGDNEALPAEAALGRRHGVAQRRATTWRGGWCLCVMSFVSHLSKRALFVGPIVKTRARSCRITDQRLDCSQAVLHSRQCLQTSAGVWHRAQSPQRPGLRVGGVLASEAGDMWVRTAFFVLSSHFRHSCR